MKLFFYNTSERQASDDFFEEIADGFFVFSNHDGKFQKDDTKERILAEVRNAQAMFFPQEVNNFIVSGWFANEYVLQQIEPAIFFSDDDKNNLADFLKEAVIDEGYRIVKREFESPPPPPPPPPPIPSNVFFTLSGQWSMFVTGLTGFLEPVYLGTFIIIFVLIVFMAGLKQNTVDAVNKVEGYLQQGQIKEAQSESQKLADGLDKRRLLIAIHEATTTPPYLPNAIAVSNKLSLTSPTSSPEVKTCYYQIKDKDTPNEVSEKFYGTSNQFSKIWADSTKLNKQGIMEVKKIIEGKESVVKATLPIQPGYLLIINDPVNHNECITDR